MFEASSVGSVLLRAGQIGCILTFWFLESEASLYISILSFFNYYSLRNVLSLILFYMDLDSFARTVYFHHSSHPSSLPVQTISLTDIGFQSRRRKSYDS